MKDCNKKINLCISNRCFLRCLGCYNNFCHKKEISYQNVFKFLEYAKEQGLKRVTLSGGDPLAREDMEIILKKCIDLDFKVNLDTVGLSFVRDVKLAGSDKIIKKFENYDLLRKVFMIGIPLDGSSNEIISKFRKGKYNLFEKQVEVIELFESLNIDICVNTVFHKGNANDMLNIYNVLKKYRCVKKWQVFQFMPIGPLGELNRDKYIVELDEFMKVSDYFKDIDNKNMNIEFKPAIEREENYMLVDSSGMAYKVDLSNRKEIFGDINDSSTWENIINNLC